MSTSLPKHSTSGECATATHLKEVLDSLSIAIFLIGKGNRLVFSNKAGDAMLFDGTFLRPIVGALNEHDTLAVPTALEEAIARITRGRSNSGIGVSLRAANGRQSAAYVMPIAGEKMPAADSYTHCAVFVAQRGAHQPMIIEILRTMFDLTSSEARIAALIAKGDGPQTIAETLGITINTVRSHLKHAFSKTSANDQTALGALVNGLMAPIT
jgi:DNA-binding CsgD family transcriptional regulator